MGAPLGRARLARPRRAPAPPLFRESGAERSEGPFLVVTELNTQTPLNIWGVSAATVGCLCGRRAWSASRGRRVASCCRQGCLAAGLWSASALGTAVPFFDMLYLSFWYVVLVFLCVILTFLYTVSSLLLFKIPLTIYKKTLFCHIRKLY